MNTQNLNTLLAEESTPCLSISLNTHRTHPENKQDAIKLKNLCKEAEERLLKEYDKREMEAIISKLNEVANNTDCNYNLNSMHIFISANTCEVVRSIFSAKEDTVQISSRFAMKPLLNNFFHHTGYAILLLSQSGAHLYEAFNDSIVAEIKGEGFPVKESGFYHTDPVKQNDPKAMDNMVREFLNRLDKSVNACLKDKNLRCIVITTEDNYSRLMQVADMPNLYLGRVTIDYNKVSEQDVAVQAWGLMQQLQKAQRANAIQEVKEAVSQGKVLTDLGEIFRATEEGRAELLVIHESFSQAARIAGDNTLELVSNSKEAGAIDDVTGHIAAQVLQKNGRVLVTAQEELNDLGQIALKLRY